MSPREFWFLTFPAGAWAVFLQARLYFASRKPAVSATSLGAGITLYNQSVRPKVFRVGLSGHRSLALRYLVRVAGRLGGCMSLHLRSSPQQFPGAWPERVILPGALQTRCCSFIGVCTWNKCPCR